MSNDEIKIIISAQNMASAAFKEVQSSINSMSSGASQALSSFANAAGKYMDSAVKSSQQFALGLAGVSTAIGFTGASMLKVAGTYEQQKVAFEVLLGSAERSKKMLKDLSDFAQVTPFNIQGVREAATQLLAYGVEQEKIIPTMRMMGDLSLGNAEKFRTLTLVYGQVKAAGRLMGQDLLQLTSAGIPIIEALAKHFNVATEEIRKMGEKGQISFKDMEESLNSLDAQGGKFFGLMARESETLPGIWSNIGDAFTRFQESFNDTSGYEGIKNLARELLDLATNTLPKVFVKIDEFIKWGIENKGMILAIAGAIIGSLVPAIASATVAFGAMMVPLLPFAAAGALIVANWGLVKGLLLVLTPILAAYTYQLVAARAATIALAIADGGLITAQIAVGVAIGVATGLIKAFFVALGPIGWVILAATALWEVFANSEKARAVLASAIDGMISGINMLGDALGGSASTFGWHFQTIEEISNSGASTVNQSLFQIITGFKNFKAAMTGLSDSFSAKFQEVKDSIMKAVSPIVDSVFPTLDGLKGKIKGLEDDMGKARLGSPEFYKLQGDIKAANDLLEKFSGAAKKHLGGGGSGVAASAKEAKKEIDELKKSMEALVEVAKTKIDIFSKKYDDLKKTFKQNSDDHKKMTESIVADYNKLNEEFEKNKQKTNEEFAKSQQGSDKDFKNNAADKFIEMQKQIVDETEKYNKIQQEMHSALNSARTAEQDAAQQKESDDTLKNIHFLEDALKKNEGFIGSIDSQIQEAKKVNAMDELSRMIYLHQQETAEKIKQHDLDMAELRTTYDAQVALLSKKRAEEDALYDEQAKSVGNHLRLQLGDIQKFLVKVGILTQESLNDQQKKLTEGLKGFNDSINTSAESSAIKNYISAMDAVTSSIDRAIKKAQDAAKLGIAPATLGFQKFANGGIFNGFGQYGVTSSPVFGMAGEAGPEAIVPLPDGRSIPVQMRGGSNGGQTVIINLTVQGSVMTQRDLVATLSNAIAGNLSSQRFVNA
ncbi:MAG: tape measure protein [Candidatus Peregrinibacteria bacterium]